MASTAQSGPFAAVNSERRFFTATAIAGVLTTFIGFTPTYFMMRWFGAPPLPLIVHVHGLMFTGWVLLYFAQTSLVAAGRRDLHMRMGGAGAVLGLLMVPLGIAVAIEGARRGAGGPARDQLAFIANPLVNLAMFAGLLTAALRQRKHSAYHKRLMLLTMLPVLTTPAARISGMLGIPVPLPVGGMAGADLFLIALALFDLKQLGRLHPVTIWGGGILLLSEPLRLIIGSTQAWRHFAAALIA